MRDTKASSKEEEMATKVYSGVSSAPLKANTAGYFSEYRERVTASDKYTGGKYSTVIPYFVGGRKANPADDYACLGGSHIVYSLLHVACWVGALISDIGAFSKVDYWAPTRSLVYDLGLASLIATIIAWVGLVFALLFYCCPDRS